MLIMSRTRSHVLVRVCVSKPDITIVAFGVIEKMLDMIL